MTKQELAIEALTTPVLYGRLKLVRDGGRGRPVLTWRGKCPLCKKKDGHFHGWECEPFDLAAKTHRAAHCVPDSTTHGYYIALDPALASANLKTWKAFVKAKAAWEGQQQTRPIKSVTFRVGLLHA